MPACKKLLHGAESAEQFFHVLLLQNILDLTKIVYRPGRRKVEFLFRNAAVEPDRGDAELDAALDVCGHAVAYEHHRVFRRIAEAAEDFFKKLFVRLGKAYVARDEQSVELVQEARSAESDLLLTES